MKHATWMMLALSIALMSAGASAHDLRPGEAVIGETAGAGSTQTFTMEMAAGDAVKLTLKATGSTGDAPAMDVEDPTGATVASAAGERKAKVRVTAEATGTYRIRLSADAATSGRYKLKIKGETEHQASSKTGVLSIGAVAGSEIRIKAKGSGGLPTMTDGRGRPVALDYAGSSKKIKATVTVGATDDYEIRAIGRRLKVTVKAPAVRGDILLQMTPGGSGGSGGASAPVAQDDPADDEAETEDEGEAQDESNNDPVAGDGGAANDGTVGGNPNDGTLPAPVVTEHSYLMELLNETANADLEAARIRLAGYEQESAALLAALVADEVADAVAAEMRDDLRHRPEGAQPANEPVLDRMLSIVAAQRRADRAAARQDVLRQEIPVSSLNADQALEVGLATLNAAEQGLRDAIAHEMGEGLAAMLRGEASPAADLRAPEATPATPENVAGLAALEQAILSGNLMARARGGDEAAADLARVLYEIYERMLAEDPAAQAALIAAGEALAELSGIEAARESEAKLDLIVESIPMPQPEEPYILRMRVAGADAQAAVVYEIDADGAVVDARHDGCEILVPGHVEERILTVRASYEGREGEAQIRVSPHPAGIRRHAVRSQVQGPNGPMANASFEIRRPGGERIELGQDNHLLYGSTDAEGNLRANYLPEGDLMLIVEAEGHADAIVHFTVEEDEGEIEVDVMLD